MGAEASADAGAEVFAEAIGDVCFGLPPGTGMFLRAAAKAAATPKPIHVHVGGGAAVTAAAAGAASHYRGGGGGITSLDDFVGQRCESFPNGQPGRIVETFQFTREGAIYVTTGTASGRNTYTRRGETLQHQQHPHVTATLRPNGELAWSHGYGSRICGGGAGAASRYGGGGGGSTSLDDFVGQRCESFPNGQPGRIVETFQFTREGGIYVTTGTASGRNTYTRHGNKLQHRQHRHITATLRPNGELAWSHGYGSRICGNGGGW